MTSSPHAPRSVAYVRTEDAPILPPPANTTGLYGWARRNFLDSMTDFSDVGSSVRSILMILLTVFLLWFGVSQIWGLIRFVLVDGVWSNPTGARREACLTEAQGGLLPNGSPVGACWPYVAANAKLFIYGRYPAAELWRPNLVFLLLGLGLVWTLWSRMPYRKLGAALMLVVFPMVAFVLLTGAGLSAPKTFWYVWPLATAVLLGLGWMGRRGIGGEAVAAFSGAFWGIGLFLAYILVFALAATTDWGLTQVTTRDWGGLLVTLVVALTGITASLPLGILLALGRRSTLPAVKILSVAFIEFWRGVPLITVLFMSSVMLPLFLPPGTSFNDLLRALIGVTLFASAYMAEVVRGGLQAIPKGQTEGAQSLGLSFWETTRLIVLPQALTLVIPGIVNTFIGLFKDTTLVSIIGMFDLLGQVSSTFADSSWATPVTRPTGYLVVAAIFFVFCFLMSRYSMSMEKKLRRGHAR
ncbi:amino acid ABC transporter permease [Neomegalonema sp.]|uniref:amino acid ABC transporter permease n=1 Tax=Neomegalonema sp. TaxID=2039713 RepID=UPI00263617FC|nr:amino acid ABC transporter permease [Neomegalonema sp.]MDD2867922.1 amino acid ABC transporter permease [Neomegalonema sp.]